MDCQVFQKDFFNFFLCSSISVFVKPIFSPHSSSKLIRRFLPSDFFTEGLFFTPPGESFPLKESFHCSVEPDPRRSVWIAGKRIVCLQFFLPFMIGTVGTTGQIHRLQVLTVTMANVSGARASPVQGTRCHIERQPIDAVRAILPLRLAADFKSALVTGSIGNETRQPSP